MVAECAQLGPFVTALVSGTVAVGIAECSSAVAADRIDWRDRKCYLGQPIEDLDYYYIF